MFYTKKQFKYKQGKSDNWRESKNKRRNDGNSDNNFKPRVYIQKKQLPASQIKMRSCGILKKEG